MYLSHPVRRMREDPIEGEAVVLVVTGEPERSLNDLEKEIESTGHAVTGQLQFGALRIETTQECIDDLCGVSGIESIETEHAIGIGGDAGEDG